MVSSTWKLSHGGGYVVDNSGCGVNAREMLAEVERLREENEIETKLKLASYTHVKELTALVREAMGADACPWCGRDQGSREEHDPGCEAKKAVGDE